jgi:uncharacterized cupredoxin-like copper-binding protein
MYHELIRLKQIAMIKINKKRFNLFLTLGLSLILNLTLCVQFTLAVSLNKQPVTEIQVSLGNVAGELKFFPNQLELISGKRYKLLLNNPSPVKHYFTSKDFADASWTQKVQVGKTEIKGAIHELELKPGGEAEWVIIPIKPGKYELHCSVAGHQEAGMIGEITIAEN